MSRISKYWLQNMGLRFWLPLPLMTLLLALLLWLSCSLIIDPVLSRSRATKDKLQSDAHLDIHMTLDVTRIEAIIDQSDPSAQVAQVEVQTAESALKKLEFEFPIAEISEVEEAIAQTLEISPQDVRNLIRYEIVN